MMLSFLVSLVWVSLVFKSVQIALLKFQIKDCHKTRWFGSNCNDDNDDDNGDDDDDDDDDVDDDDRWQF